MNWFKSLFNKKQKTQFQIEGTYENTYSLSMVNKAIARALEQHISNNVKVYATKQHEAYMNEQNDIDEDIQKMVDNPLECIDITIRNIYPPNTQDMQGSHKIIGPYGWEESKFPKEYVVPFNQDLTLVLTMSSYVKNLLKNNGVNTPIYTTGIIVEDILKISSVPLPFDLPKGFRLLHISSAFPRKGIDILLKAFQMIEDNQNISLILKTFPNEHNDILNQLDEQNYKIEKQYEDDVLLYRNNDKKILLINKNVSQSQIKYLYENSDILVAPSFGEGFGLPMAEAMLLNLPVIATAFGGQSDFCTQETSWLIDFDFDYAKTHINLKNSLWQVPKKESLKYLIEHIYNLPKNEIKLKTKKAKNYILHHYSSKKVANNIIEAIFKVSQKRQSKIALFSTYNTRCGIALYSKYLISSFSNEVTIFSNITKDDDKKKDSSQIIRCWHERGRKESIRDLKNKILQKKITKLIIQYNFSFISLPKLQELILFCYKNDVDTYLFMHSTQDVITPTYTDSFGTITEGLKKATQIYVHTLEDINYLKNFGIYKNISIFDHGINTTFINNSKEEKNTIPILSTFGFLLPQKGILELVDVVENLHKRDVKVKLLILASIHPAAVSKELEKELKEKIKNSNISTYITLNTNFLEEKDIILQLSKTDKILFIYKNTAESSSAAVRMGLLAQKEVITTPSPIFDDVKSVVTQTKNHTIDSISQTIIDSLHTPFNNTELKLFLEKNSWKNISKDFYQSLS